MDLRRRALWTELLIIDDILYTTYYMLYTISDNVLLYYSIYSTYTDILVKSGTRPRAGASRMAQSPGEALAHGWPASPSDSVSESLATAPVPVGEGPKGEILTTKSSFL